MAIKTNGIAILKRPIKAYQCQLLSKAWIFIFFIIFTPIGILMRLFGRDELLLQFKAKSSYWTKRLEDIHSNSFRRQF